MLWNRVPDPVTGLAWGVEVLDPDRFWVAMMPVITCEAPVAVWNRYWLVEVVLIICVRVAPNIGGVLKEVHEDVQIGVMLRLVVLVIGVFVIEFDVTEVVQDAG